MRKKEKLDKRHCRLCKINGKHTELVEINRDGKLIRICKNCRSEIV